ncbi:MAG: type II CAAX endopeptidase family protein [Candidatus Saccharimonadales bacterium]
MAKDLKPLDAEVTNKNSEKPKSRLYGPVLSILITLVVYALGQLLGGLIVGLVVGYVNHWTPAQVASWLSSGNAYAQFWFVLATEIISVGMIYKFLRWRKSGFKDIGIGKIKPNYVLYSIVGFGLYFLLFFVVVIVVKLAIPSLDLEQKQELGLNMSATGSALWPYFISLVILPPIAEEILVRGFLFGGLRTKLRVWPAAIIASTLFAAAHLPEASNGLLWVGAIDTFVLSMVLCFLREETKSLWPSIGVHMIKNGLAFVLLFNVFQYIK